VDITIKQLDQDLALGAYSTGTRLAYRKVARELSSFLDKPLGEATRDEVRSYVELLSRRGLSPASFNKQVSGLRFVFGRTLGKPEMVSFLRRHRAPSVLPQILSQQEVQALLNAIRSPRYQALAMVMYGSGLRVSEAIALTVQDIDGARGVIRVMHGKGGVAREAKLSASLYQWLRDYWTRERPPLPHLFAGPHGSLPYRETVGKALAAAAQAAAITKRVTPHVLRHSFATHLLEEGVDVRVVSALLGHASLHSTTRYARVTTKVVRQTPSPLDLLPPVRR
jgi:integrase/recombinase XerD